MVKERHSFIFPQSERTTGKQNKKGLQKAGILYGCRLLVLQWGGQQEGEQLNQVLHYPKYTHPQKRPNIWKFKIARVKVTRPPCRESRRLPMASTVKKTPPV